MSDVKQDYAEFKEILRAAGYIYGEDATANAFVGWHLAQQRMTFPKGTRFLVVALDDDRNGHPQCAADSDGVRDIIAGLMYSTTEPLDAEQSKEIDEQVEALFDSGELTFEGDPPVYLFQLPEMR